MHTLKKMLFLTMLCALGAGALDVPALPYWTKSYSYDGICHGYDCTYPYHEEFREWGDDPGIICRCLNACTGTAATSGKITVTLTYSGGPPPDHVWIRETADATWWARTDYYNCSFAYVNGWANASISDTYHQLTVQYHPYDVKWESKGERKVRVSLSSGTIVRTAAFFARAEALLGCNQYGYVQVEPNFDVAITEIPSGPEIPTKVVPPPYRSRVPADPVGYGLNQKWGGTQHGQAPDPVDLASGLHLYLPSPDIIAYDPYGPVAAYQRNHLSDRANGNYASPGLTVGWVDNYDLKLTAESPGTWGALRITYPNGAYELLTPELDEYDAPTGQFVEPAEAPYYVVGVPSGTTGQWQSVDVTFKDQTTWRFDSPASDTYMLGRIANRMGRYVSVQRVSGTDHRVTSVTDDSSPANTLMSFAYDGNNRLSSITDAYDRKVTYTYGSAAGTTCLLSVSQIVPSATANPPAGFSFGYDSIGGHPHLTSIAFPNPTGTGQSTQTVNYAYDDVRNAYVVSSLVDANGNQRVFLYESNKATRVQVKDAQGNVKAERVENFDIENGNRSTGNVLEAQEQGGGVPTTTPRMASIPSWPSSASRSWSPTTWDT